jgi:hypothetical protein
MVLNHKNTPSLAIYLLAMLEITNQGESKVNLRYVIRVRMGP